MTPRRATRTRPAWGAILLLARSELARRWRALLAIGVAAGLVAAVVVGAIGLARRTATAHDRLVAAAGTEDVRATVFGDEALARDVATLPGVAESSRNRLAVGRVEGAGFTYVGVRTAEDASDDLDVPVVVRGRAADPDVAEEVVVAESVAAEAGIEPGDTLRLAFLTAEEVASFDVGFGEPDGPRIDLVVTGLARTTGIDDQPPVRGGPALAARLRDITVGFVVLLRYDPDDPAAATRVQEGADELRAAHPTPPGAEEFDPVELVSTGGDAATAAETTRALVGGLAVVAVVAGLVGMLALAQALGRQHRSAAGDQRIEAALGLTAGERSLARTIAAGGASASAAATVAVLGATAAAGLGPVGPIARFEPEPGWAPNVTVLAAGALATAVAVTAVAAVSARRAGASADRLAADPARYGWQADVAVIDAFPAVVDDLLADPLVGDLTLQRSAAGRIEGRSISVYALSPVVGDIGWTAIDGRQPGTDDEVLLGAALARDLDADIGDRVSVAPPGRSELTLRVSGIGFGPVTNGEPFGQHLLVTDTRLDDVATASGFTEGLVRAAPGVDVTALDAALAERYELQRPAAPSEVADLLALGRLPAVLGGFLAAIAMAALVHAVVTTSRRGAGDLAVLRAIGFTRADTVHVLVLLALATALAGVVVGVPLGLGVGPPGVVGAGPRHGSGHRSGGPGLDDRRRRRRARGGGVRRLVPGSRGPAPRSRPTPATRVTARRQAEEVRRPDQSRWSTPASSSSLCT